MIPKNEILRSQNERLKDAKGHTKAIILNNIRKTKNRIQILEDQLARMENHKALQTLVEKERAEAEVRYQKSIDQVLQVRHIKETALRLVRSAANVLIGYNYSGFCIKLTRISAQVSTPRTLLSREMS